MGEEADTLVHVQHILSAVHWRRGWKGWREGRGWREWRGGGEGVEGDVCRSERMKLQTLFFPFYLFTDV